MPLADELRSMLEAVLAIPLAERLPTGNARKTCALAISLLQNQRLPRSVLEPCKDRIVTALQRAIDGELGKEGKKGRQEGKARIRKEGQGNKGKTRHKRCSGNYYAHTR